MIPDEFSSERDFDKFFTALGSGSKDTVPEESAGGDDQVPYHESKQFFSVKKDF